MKKLILLQLLLIKYFLLKKFTVCFFFFIIFLFVSISGSAQKLNRIYVNGNYGYKNHPEVGIVLHGYNNFCIAIYQGKTKIATGPWYYPSEAFFSGERLKNKYTFTTLFLGFKTYSKKIFDISIMGGLSRVHYFEYYNIEKIPGYTYSVSYVKYNTREGDVLGKVIRGDLLISLNRIIALNFSIQYNFNPIRNDLNVMFGINLGLVKDRTIQGN